MVVDVRVDGELLTLRAGGKLEDRDALGWADHVREAARASGGAVCILVVFEQGLEISVALLAAASRQTFGVMPLIKAAALVGHGATERAMLRASTLAVRPDNPVEVFEDEASARAWLAQFGRSKGARAPTASGG